MERVRCHARQSSPAGSAPPWHGRSKNWNEGPTTALLPINDRLRVGILVRSTPPAAPASARPAEGLLHPIVPLALAVLVVNDQVLKAVWPGLVTGKLSDFAGLVIAPIALQAVWEIGEWVAGRWHGPSSAVLAVSITVVGIWFAAIQVWPPATDAYRWGLGAAQWPFRAIGALLAGSSPPGVLPVVLTADAEDVLALPVLLVTWWIGRRRTSRS
jgi:hypothetical protein